MDMIRHPAKFSDPIKERIFDLYLHFDCKGPIYDPFAGVGGVHDIAFKLGVSSVGCELEPEWAEQYQAVIGNGGELHATYVGSCLTFSAHNFGTVITSPCYGNRMADHHDARDDSVRNTYRHTLGRPLSADNSGAMQWGPEYRRFHELVWNRIATQVLRPGGHLILNVSDHIRRGKVQHVSRWHVNALEDAGFKLLGCTPVPTKRNRFGANRDVRVPGEMIYVMRLHDDNE